MMTLKRAISPPICCLVMQLFCVRQAAAAPISDDFQLMDSAAAQELLLTVSSSGAAFDRSALVPRSLMVYRFNAEAVRADGVDLPAGSWLIVIYAVRSDGDTVDIALLDHRSASLQLPRPLGFLLRQGDVIGVRVRSDASLIVRVRAGYDATAEAPSRLHVSPVTGWLAIGETERDWEWRATSSGRVMAFGGAALRGARELGLYDETGALIWRERLQQRPGEAESSANETVYVGAAIEAGRTYRLRITSADAASEAGGAIQALVLAVETIRVASAGVR